MQDEIKVLVADDNEPFRFFLKTVLELAGHPIIEADDGAEALSFLLEENGPQMAILDWQMPQLDGIEVCRQLRKKKDHADTYVLLVTGQQDSDVVVSALEAGADDFLNKPCRKEEILARVRAGVRMVALHREKIEMVSKLQQRQKLESIGQLAAGIAHEINTPVQYISDNTKFIEESIDDIKALIQAVQDIHPLIKSNAVTPDDIESFDRSIEDADLGFLLEQIPLAINQSLDGLRKVTEIVRAMKEFSHPGTEEFREENLNHAIESALTVTRNEWKYVADAVTEFDTTLPDVPCILGDLNQVFINLIINAAHAIAEKNERNNDKTKGILTLSSDMSGCGQYVQIHVADTGTGIPQRIRHKIFDPFFTTKSVGKGTGQGLALAHRIVAEKHGGELLLDTEEETGTTFTIRIPIEQTLSKN